MNEISINVAQLLKSPPGTRRAFEFDERVPEAERSDGVRGPIAGRAELTRTQRGILAQAVYQATVELACGRCLETFQTPLSGSLDQEFLPRVDLPSGQPLPLEPDQVYVTPEHELDLTETIRQDILLRIPLQPLCRETCPGLCPECGAALSRERCDCRPAPPASPFEALAELLRDRSPEKRDGG